jgi:hypothetical protein
MNMLTKIAQNKNIFVRDFVDIVKLAQYELYRFNCNPYAKLKNSTFEYYNYIKV